MELGVRGRTAIVTGGSKGIGRAIAEEFVREGIDVAVCARGESELLEAAEALREGGGRVHAQVADVTDAEQIADLVARSAEALGGIDILVNNAGQATPGRFETLDDALWQGDIDVKLFSQIRCTRAVVPQMRRRGGGRIVNINAVYGKHVDPAFFATSVNRAATLALNRALAIELAADNILVNSVNIGFVRTPQWERIHRRRAPDLPREEFLDKMARDEVPLGRFGAPEEVSGIVAFLVSDRAAYITGASIDVAGGMGRYA